MFHVKRRHKRDYQNFEALRVAMLLTFLSDFIDSYTFLTQGRRFAGLQTGNLLYMMIHLADGRILDVLSYFIPLFFFILGQVFAYFLRRWTDDKHYRWHRFSTYVLLVLLLFIAILSPLLSSVFTIGSLAFFASIKLVTFKRVRGYQYTNLMMTGNIRVASYLFTKGWVEKNQLIFKQALYITTIIASFMMGVMVSTILSHYFVEFSLYAALFPMIFLAYFVSIESEQTKNP